MRVNHSAKSGGIIGIYFRFSIGDKAPSIRIVQVFPELVGKKTHALWKVYGGMLIYIINYALYLAHYDAYFHINDNAKNCRYVSVANILFYFFLFSHNSFKLLSHEVL